MKQKFLVILLSFIMLFVMIPATAIATEAEIRTIEDVLATVEFPTSSVYGWRNNTSSIYNDGDSLYILYPGNGAGGFNLNTNVTENSGNYIASASDITYTFIMENGALKQINIAGYSSNKPINGTYEAPINIASLLKTVPGFPESNSTDSVPDNAWVCGTNKWCFVNTTNDKVIFYSIDDQGAHKNDNIYRYDIPSKVEGSYQYSHMGYTYTFNMNGNVLKSITVSGSATKYYDGTYAKNNSGNTSITATKEAGVLSYDMVIPEAVSITTAGTELVGAPSVENVKNATSNTVIEYTATGTNFIGEGEAEITASYYTDSSAQTTLPNTAIRVFQNKQVVNPLTEIYVNIAQTDWDDADSGTYTATVTFTFNDYDFK